MALTNNQILSIARALANYFESEGGYYSLSKIKVSFYKDNILYALFTKADSKQDKIKVIYATYFLLNRPDLTVEHIIDKISNLYVMTVEFYDDTNTIKMECGDCYGDGYEECDECDGSGNIDCSSCDGEGRVDCDYCDDGNNQCSNCDGSGTETGEDDEGEEVEEPCSVCDGDGQEECRECGGHGNFECYSCDGSGNETCGECDGGGQNYCRHCSGSGEVESGEDYFNITRAVIITIGNSLQKYENELIDLEDYEKMDDNNEEFEDNLTFETRYYDDDIPEYERLEKIDIETTNDKFVEVVDFVKLEETKI